MASPDRKRGGRRKDPDLMRILKHEHDECELCGDTTNLHLHHALHKSQTGDDTRANIVCLCRDCHEGLHRRDEWVSRRFVALLQHRRRDTTEYVADKLGGAQKASEWLLRHVR